MVVRHIVYVPVYCRLTAIEGVVYRVLQEKGDQWTLEEVMPTWKRRGAYENTGVSASADVQLEGNAKKSTPDALVEGMRVTIWPKLPWRFLYH